MLNAEVPDEPEKGNLGGDSEGQIGVAQWTGTSLRWVDS